MTPDAVRLDLCTRGYDAAAAALLAAGWPGAEEGTEPWFNFPYVQAQLPADLRQRCGGVGRRAAGVETAA